ncbi:MAG: histidine kinase [Clostridiales bacterium]|nr:histidine kinase [Clostridiales bacterium]
MSARKWRLRDVSLRVKLLVSYCVVLTVPLGLLGLYAQQMSQQYVRDYARQSLTAMVERAAGSLSMKLEQYGQFVDFSIANPRMQSIYINQYDSYYALYADLSEWLAPFFSGIRSIAGKELRDIKIYSEQGLEKYGEALLPARLAEGKAWYRRACASPYPVYGYDGEDRALYIARRIQRSGDLLNQDPLGVLRLSLRADLLLEGYADIGWPEYCYALLNGDGTPIVRQGRGVSLPAQTYPAAGEPSVTYQGQTYLAFSADVAGPGWRVVYLVPDRSTASVRPKIATVNTILLAVAAPPLLAAIWLFTSALLRGIRRLERKMDRVAGGELDLEVRSDARDEIGRLTNRFGHMLATVNALIGERERTQRKLADLQLKALRAQIDPHFLYNTLSRINWRAIRTGDEETVFLVEQLATFYRTCLNKGQALIRVEDEIANVRAYLEIQKRMHRDSFDAAIDVESAIMGRYMLNFLLQPLVENAVQHGVEHKRAGRGAVTVRGFLSGGALCFEVSDNGPGLPADLDVLNAPTRGYGLQNVVERIRLRYGPQYGVEVTSTAGGCAARIRIPALDAPDDGET